MTGRKQQKPGPGVFPTRFSPFDLDDHRSHEAHSGSGPTRRLDPARNTTVAPWLRTSRKNADPPVIQIDLKHLELMVLM